MTLHSSYNSNINSTKFLALFLMFLLYSWLFANVCTLQGNLHTFFTLILGSVFSDCVVFYRKSNIRQSIALAYTIHVQANGHKKHGMEEQKIYEFVIFCKHSNRQQGWKIKPVCLTVGETVKMLSRLYGLVALAFGYRDSKTRVNVCIKRQ